MARRYGSELSRWISVRINEILQDSSRSEEKLFPQWNINRPPQISAHHQCFKQSWSKRNLATVVLLTVVLWVNVTSAGTVRLHLESALEWMFDACSSYRLPADSCGALALERQLRRNAQDLQFAGFQRFHGVLVPERLSLSRGIFKHSACLLAVYSGVVMLLNALQIPPQIITRWTDVKQLW